LLSLVAACGEAGRRAGKPVGVCGEAAADPLLAPVLVGLGITSLSMSARALPLVGATLARLSLADCAALARLAADADTAAAATHRRPRARPRVTGADRRRRGRPARTPTGGCRAGRHGRRPAGAAGRHGRRPAGAAGRHAADRGRRGRAAGRAGRRATRAVSG
jgi:hypothetical protein